MSLPAQFGHRAISLLTLALAASLSCNKVPEPGSEKVQQSEAAASKTAPAASQAAADKSVASKGASAMRPAPAAAKAAPEGDPEAGDFTLDEALTGLEGKGAPVAEIETDSGLLKCDLFQDKAPITVANFIGLARGTRAWKNPKGEWVKVPAYDGTIFHRIIKGFMIQGGDPEGSGKGGPGYVFKDEVWEGATHDRRGLLCMANRGPNTNGAQFFILDAAARHLDHSFTIFGECKPDNVIEKLASVPTKASRPDKPPVIKRITIKRK